jgi:hypothetical protein
MMIERINAARAGRGLAALRPNAQLEEAARGHAADLAAHPALTAGDSHTGSDGSSIEDRQRRAGYDPDWWGEITGWGFGGNDAQMMAWWMASPAHAAAILKPQFEDVGVADMDAPGSQWGHYWVVEFGRGDGAEPEPPRPYTSYVPVVTTPSNSMEIDLLPYLRGDGRSYRVGNGGGSFEVFQTQSEGDAFYQIKAWDDLSVVNWEGFSVDNEFIRRDVDTSPGGGRFYRQFNAPWVRRYMRPGQSFAQQKRVQFYRASDCAPLGVYSGTVTDVIEFVAHHRRYTFPARDWRPVTLDDVIELRWTQGERYWYARGYGLVGWRREHNDPNSPAWSAISEMRPGVGRLERMRIHCL